MESSKGFRSLMLKMVRVETEREYEELWKAYNKELLGEPFLPAKYRVKEDTNFTMTPEFTIIVKQKENDVEDMMEELEGSEAGDKVNSDEVKPSTALSEPQNEAPEEEDNQCEEEEDVGDDVKLLHQV